MPTAKSAAPGQPTTHVHRTITSRRRHAVLALAALVLGGSIVLPVQTLFAPAAAAQSGPACSGWSSETRPPDYIRVLRRHSGRVERVPFRKYVITVMGKEWPGYLPHAVIEAGAVAVKQYAWYHSLGRGRVSRSGQCFDVTDGVGDQLYKPNRARIRADHYAALDTTWGVRLLKHGSLFMTGYRSGSKGHCGHDATGWKLFARSATRCAGRGMGYLQILRVYYGPGLTIIKSGSSARGTADSPDEVVSSDEADSASSPGGVTAQSTPAQAPSASPVTAYVVPHQAVMDTTLGAPVISGPVSAERPFALV